MKKITVCLFASVALGTFAGCQSQNTTTKTGSYTAARRNSLGSHIPQPYSADSTNSTVDDSYMREQERMSNASSSVGRGSIGGGGGR